MEHRCSLRSFLLQHLTLGSCLERTELIELKKKIKNLTLFQVYEVFYSKSILQEILIHNIPHKTRQKKSHCSLKFLLFKLEKLWKPQEIEVMYEGASIATIYRMETSVFAIIFLRKKRYGKGCRFSLLQKLICTVTPTWAAQRPPNPHSVAPTWTPSSFVPRAALTSPSHKTGFLIQQSSTRTAAIPVTPAPRSSTKAHHRVSMILKHVLWNKENKNQWHYIIQSVLSFAHKSSFVQLRTLWTLSRNNTVKAVNDKCSIKTNRDGAMILVYSVLLKHIYNF